MKYAKGGHCQVACAKYFELSHGISDGGTEVEMVIQHPNQYFENSQKLLKGKIYSLLFYFLEYSKTPLSRPPVSRNPRLPPGFSFVRNRLLYKVYAIRHRHPPTVFNVPMYLK